MITTNVGLFVAQPCRPPRFAELHCAAMSEHAARLCGAGTVDSEFCVFRGVSPVALCRIVAHGGGSQVARRRCGLPGIPWRNSACMLGMQAFSDSARLTTEWQDMWLWRLRRPRSLCDSTGQRRHCTTNGGRSARTPASAFLARSHVDAHMARLYSQVAPLRFEEFSASISRSDFGAHAGRGELGALGRRWRVQLHRCCAQPTRRLRTAPMRQRHSTRQCWSLSQCPLVANALKLTSPWRRELCSRLLSQTQTSR